MWLWWISGGWPLQREKKKEEGCVQIQSVPDLCVPRLQSTEAGENGSLLDLLLVFLSTQRNSTAVLA